MRGHDFYPCFTKWRLSRDKNHVRACVFSVFRTLKIQNGYFFKKWILSKTQSVLKSSILFYCVTNIGQNINPKAQRAFEGHQRYFLPRNHSQQTKKRGCFPTHPSSFFAFSYSTQFWAVHWAIVLSSELSVSGHWHMRGDFSPLEKRRNSIVKLLEIHDPTSS